MTKLESLFISHHFSPYSPPLNEFLIWTKAKFLAGSFPKAASMAPVPRSKRLIHVPRRQQNHSRRALNPPILGQLNGNQLQRSEKDNDGRFKSLEQSGPDLSQIPFCNDKLLQVQIPSSSLRLDSINIYI